MINKNILNKAVLICGVLIFLIIGFSFIVNALNIPSNIQKITDYNNGQANFYFSNLSFIIAFLAGILGILTPCSLVILPAFFAYSFKGKKDISKMTFSFFLGFMPVFVVFGLIATFLGKSIATFQQSNSFFVIIAGILTIFLGLMVLFGKGFSGITLNKNNNKSAFGIFIFGILFALGFTVCMGPILVGILLIAGVLQNYFYAGILMLFYSLGLFVPLFLMSIFFDKYNFIGFMSKINKKLGFSLTNVISGILLISLGLIFIIFKGTTRVTGNLGLGSWTIIIYSIQEKIVNVQFINVIGFFVLIGFVYLVWRVLKKEIKLEKK